MTTATGAAPGTEHWLDLLARARRSAPGLPGWAEAIRQAAAARFAGAGFPAPADEEWRKTSVAPIARGRFAPAADAGVPDPAAAALERASYAPRGGSRMVFVNGRHAPNLSAPGTLPPGVILCRLDEAMRSHRALVEPWLERQAAEGPGRFHDLNTAFLDDGIFVHVPENVRLAGPIHLLYATMVKGGGVAGDGAGGGVAGDGAAAPMTHPLNLVMMAAGSRARVVESYVAVPGDAAAGPPSTAYFTNAVTAIVLGAGAVVDHCKLQRESVSAYHVADLSVRQERSSRFTSHSIALGGGLVRNDVNAVLADEGAECTLNGLYMTAGSQHVDNHTTIDHAKPGCVSRELYKGVLDGRSRAVFNGKIIVRPDAHGTDSVQANRNLLLSQEALVDTKPELQIYNNDVKCKHAAAIGQIDETALFYLRSRAIGAEAARALLVHAFVSDIVARIPVEPLRESLERLLMARLPENAPAAGAAS